MNMLIDDDLWSELEGSKVNEQGVVKRRLIPDGLNDVFLAVGYPNNDRQIIFSFEKSDSLKRLSPTALVEPEFVFESNGVLGELRFRLKSNEGQSVFTAFCNDLVTEFQANRDRLVPIERVIRRYELWRLLLSPEGREGMSKSRQQGLFGELLLLEELMNQIDVGRAISSWTGPLNDSVDFNVNGFGIEVKTTAGLRPIKVRISSERQLSDEGLLALLLNVYELIIRRDGSGQTLNEIVARISESLGGEDLSIFKDLLVSSGYIEPHYKKYESTYYAVLEKIRYRVTKHFPRITSSDLPKGIGNINYDLFLDACEEFRMNDDTLRKYLQNHE